MKQEQRKAIRVPQEKQDIAIVLSLFNENITRGLLAGSCRELERHGYQKQQVRVFEVPGAFEIPLVAKKLAESKKYCGVIALGCIIRGETPHFEYVSQAAALGCLQASLDAGCPVSFGVLTVNHENQALERSRLNEFNKGLEAAAALLETLSVLESIPWESDARPESSRSKQLSK